MDDELRRFSTTLSSCKSNFESKQVKRLTCRRSLETYSSCRCKRTLFKKVAIVMRMDLSRRSTAPVQLPFTPSPSRFSSHTWVEAVNNRLFRSSWKGVILESCFLMIPSHRKIARPSECLAIAAWAMTEVLPLGSRKQLRCDFEGASMLNYSVKVSTMLITNQLSSPRFRRTLNSKTDKIVKLRALNASMRHPLRMSTVWEPRKLIKQDSHPFISNKNGVPEVT